MKCICQDPACRKEIFIDTDGAVQVDWSGEERAVPSVRVYIDVQTAVTMIQELRAYVEKQMEKSSRL